MELEQLTQEIEELIEVLKKAKTPTNLDRPENAKIERGLRKEMAEYFKALSNAFPYGSLDSLYYKHVKED